MTVLSESNRIPTAGGGSAAAFVGGVSVAGDLHDLPDPLTGETIARAGWGSTDDVNQAVAAAGDSWAEWKATAPRDRARALRAIADELRELAEPLGHLVVSETGKRAEEARGEIHFSAQYFDWFAEAAVMVDDQARATAQRRFLVRHEPVGVTAAITPWNFPVSIPARKIAPALAAGCPVILKPSELTPRSGLALVAIAQKHLPRGLVGAVVGDGQVITTALVDHADVACISFTGSTRVGSLVAQRAMKSMTRVVMELGGMAPFIITEEANIDAAVDALMIAKFRNNGASCIAANNIFIHSRHYAAVVDTLRERIKKLKVGDPRTESTELGPLIRSEEVDRMETLVSDARTRGAIVTQGQRPENGWFYPPTLVELGEQTPGLWTGEIFGPVCAVRSYDDIDSVIDEVHEWRTGLAGYVMSQNEEAALALGQRLRVGIVGINNGAPNTPEVPFGGFGLAGLGREGGVAGMMEFMESQTISVAR